MTFLPMQFPLRDVVMPGPVETVALLLSTLAQYVIPVALIGLIIVGIVKLIKKIKAKRFYRQYKQSDAKSDHAVSNSAHEDSDS